MPAITRGTPAEAPVESTLAVTDSPGLRVHNADRGADRCYHLGDGSDHLYPVTRHLRTADSASLLETEGCSMLMNDSYD